jgi:hypothetical protein
MMNGKTIRELILFLTFGIEQRHQLHETGNNSMIILFLKLCFPFNKCGNGYNDYILFHDLPSSSKRVLSVDSSMQSWYRILPCRALHYNDATVSGEINGRQRLVAESLRTAIMVGLRSIGISHLGDCFHYSVRFPGFLTTLYV